MFSIHSLYLSIISIPFYLFFTLLSFLYPSILPIPFYISKPFYSIYAVPVFLVHYPCHYLTCECFIWVSVCSRCLWMFVVYVCVLCICSVCVFYATVCSVCVWISVFYVSVCVCLFCSFALCALGVAVLCVCVFWVRVCVCVCIHDDLRHWIIRPSVVYRSAWPEP